MIQQLPTKKKYILALVSIAWFVWPLSTQAASSFNAIDLSSIYGNDAGEEAGYSVDKIGDMNGDGLEDIAIGVPGSSTEELSGNGALYFVYGKSKRYGALTLNGDAGNISRLDGENRGDDAGYAVAGVGDINNDGFDDVIVSAPREDSGGTSSGAVYIVYGKAEKYANTSLSNFPKVTGEGSIVRLGEDLAGAGDINGDGFADMLIGAPRENNRRGAAFVLYGQAEEFSSNPISSSGAVELGGENSFDYAGTAVAGVGDINGDGLDDFAVGSERFDGTDKSSAGGTHLIFGKSEKFTDANLDEVANVTLIGATEKEEAGTTLANAGDIDADGFADFLIGAPESNFGGDEAGVAYVVYGQATWPSEIGLFTATQEVVPDNFPKVVRFNGYRKEDYVGGSLANAGDVNNDGHNDFIIGAPSQHQKRAGDAYIVYGKAERFTHTSVANLERYTGERNRDEFGTSVAMADLNGDGKSEIIVGTPNHLNPSGKDSGTVYIGYLPIITCDNSAALGGIMSQFPEASYKIRKFAPNRFKRIIVDRKGKMAYVVNCRTDEITQTIQLNKNAQRKTLVRVFKQFNKPVALIVTRHNNKRQIKLFFYKQGKKQLNQTDFIKRKWRRRGLRLKTNPEKVKGGLRHRIRLDKGKEKKNKVWYGVNSQGKLRLREHN